MSTYRPAGLRLPLLLAAAAITGCLGALATHGFRLLLDGMSRWLFGEAGGPVQVAGGLPPELRVLTPVIGGIVAGWLLQRLPPARQHSADYMESIALGNGHLSWRATLLRAASSASSIVSGSSIGREGSMIQLAALAGSLSGQLARLTAPQRRLLLACGAAAGVSAAYNTPIAGALFVGEIIVRSVAIETLGPLLLAAACAQLVGAGLFGDAAIYQLPSLALHGGTDWLWFGALGVVAGLVMPGFQRLLQLSKSLFGRLPCPLWLKLGIGGAIVGGLSLLTPHVWGNGYSTIDHMLHSAWPVGLLLGVLICKILATAAATGSGAVGGIFTPTLFVGAVLGAIFGHAVQALTGQPAGPLWVVAGMGALLAGATQAPLMTIIMLIEMTRAPLMAVPLMLAVATAHLTVRMLGCRSIYAHALPDEENVRQSVLDVMYKDTPQLSYPVSLRQLADTFATWRWQHVYITHPRQGFMGAVPIHDFHHFQRQESDPDRPIPDALIRRDFPRVSAGMSLSESLELMIAHHGERLPVVGDDGRLLGHLRKSDLLKRLGSRWRYL
ncbi:ClcB-like voltage-gated chloride channel protein [Pseudogulbenkiania sp. MAI-1]|uniref:ClcB-like voltage-gated chloride channel protein n=1 Tax=Pseudogulbenkiania sp. MAI-1 TaxID=990370 RepID=UPI00045EAF85|nr:ClcB-like voltage-gated chloride channel protein [Pseudogulbenkiania sp. MAI-1]